LGKTPNTQELHRTIRALLEHMRWYEGNGDIPEARASRYERTDAGFILLMTQDEGLVCDQTRVCKIAAGWLLARLRCLSRGKWGSSPQTAKRARSAPNFAAPVSLNRIKTKICASNANKWFVPYVSLL
jgi:hypothetical protein